MSGKDRQSVRKPATKLQHLKKKLGNAGRQRAQTSKKK